MDGREESRLVAFYRGTGVDHAGRRIGEIWEFSMDELEYHHDYIQWLFPLEVRSPVNPEAPVVDAGVRAAFVAEEGLRRNFRKSLDVMMRFYGLWWEGGKVVRTEEFEERAGEWLTPGNHNHLRLTRILRSAMLCGLGEEGRALRGALLEIAGEFPGRVTGRTRGFWERAMEE